MFKSKLNVILFPIVLCAFLFGIAYSTNADCPACPAFNNCAGDLELLTLKNRTQNTPSWQSSISANAGDTVAFNVYYHNCVSDTTANNTKVRLDFSNIETSPILATAYLWADNASYVTDSGTITVNTPQKLNFASTAKWYPDQSSSNPTIVPVTVNITSAQVTIGNIQGNWTHQGYVVFEATLSGSSVNHPPTANAGSDKDIQEGEITTLNGSGSDPDSDPITYSWSCTGGSLSSYSTAQPTYTAPSVSYNTYYTCTLTVRDDKGLTSSDSMTVYVRNQDSGNLYVSLTPSPSSGYAPLNNVSLTAYLSGSATGDATFKFDCTNDGSWERITTANSNSNTAYSLCNYYSNGNYTARTEVTRGGMTNSATAPVYVGGSYQTGSFVVTKLVKNLSDGTGWQTTVAADPGEVLYFSIQVTAVNNSNDVVIKDVLPAKLTYGGDLRLDNVPTAGDIINGLNIGYMSANQTRTITFRAVVANADQFVFGTTELTNTAQVNNSTLTGGTAKISVTRGAVAGITTVVTGINPLFISLIVALSIALVFYFFWTNLEKSQNASARKFLSWFYRMRSLIFK